MWCGRAGRRLAAATRRVGAGLGAWTRAVERELVLLVALGLIAAGCWLWSPALGLLAPGLVLLWLAIGPDVVHVIRGDIAPRKRDRP